MAFLGVYLCVKKNNNKEEYLCVHSYCATKWNFSHLSCLFSSVEVRTNNSKFTNKHLKKNISDQYSHTHTHTYVHKKTLLYKHTTCTLQWQGGQQEASLRVVEDQGDWHSQKCWFPCGSRKIQATLAAGNVNNYAVVSQAWLYFKVYYSNRYALIITNTCKSMAYLFICM